MAIAGIDIGTTGCKCSSYSKSGELLYEAYREYSIIRKEENCEIDPRVVLKNVYEVIKEVADNSEKLDAIGVTSFGESAVLLDEKDETLMNSILYMDHRGQKEC